ncbi:MAG: DsbA family oxidoreductase [Nitrospirota bacterium]|nr:DsbA family oxidoreductase [Nitrospirota bacterium]MDP2384356.1 DsbA family oxidoreductase [Nitrospirota bacterium]MDP3596861.1 DsbA family oxidoreductase [Nitrospirota bacterium]
MTDRALTIDIYSDVVCPWCFIGKRRLERALDQLNGAAPANITWRPFQLNPTMPEGGLERRAYLEAKFGSLDAFRQMEEHVLAAGAEEHIAFAFENIARTPNTFLAHRLIWYAGQQGRQDAVVESLFRGYFEEGADIGSIPVLVELGERVGLDAGSFLRSDEGVSKVKEEAAAGHRLGIRAVPYFLLNGTYALSGAQPTETFVSALKAAGSGA